MCCARWPAARGIGPCITMMVLTEWFACLVSGAPSHTCSASQPCGPSVEAHTPGCSPLNSVRARLGAVRRSAEWLPERTSWAAMSAGYWVGRRTGSSGAPLLCPGSRWHCCDSAVRVVIGWPACTPLGSGWGGTAGRTRQSESWQALRDTLHAARVRVRLGRHGGPHQAAVVAESRAGMRSLQHRTDLPGVASTGVCGRCEQVPGFLGLTGHNVRHIGRACRKFSLGSSQMTEAGLAGSS